MPDIWILANHDPFGRTEEQLSYIRRSFAAGTAAKIYGRTYDSGTRMFNAPLLLVIFDVLTADGQRAGELAILGLQVAGQMKQRGT